MKTFWGRHKYWPKILFGFLNYCLSPVNEIHWLLDSTMFCTSHHCHLSGGRNLEIQISGSLVILQPLPGTGLNRSIKEKGWFFFMGYASLSCKAELELLLPTLMFTAKFLCRGSVPRSPDGATSPSSFYCLHLAANKNMTRLCKRVGSVMCVFDPISAFPFTRDGSPTVFNYILYCHLYFDQISFTLMP